MKYKNIKIFSNLLLVLLIIISLVACNKKEDSTKVKETSTSEQVIDQTNESKVVEEEIKAPIKEEITKEIFDESKLGYSVKNNQVLLNDKPFATTSKVEETTRDEDKTTYHFYDGAALVIKSNGDLIVDFPIRLTLLIDKDFTSFETLYKGETLTKANIVDFITENNWYTIDYGNNINLKFNNETLIFLTNNLKIIQKEDSCETVFKDFIISNSKISSVDATSSNMIKINYEDNNKLTHIVGGSTTFIFQSGTAVESDGKTTKIKKDGQETIINGDIKNIDYIEETNNILLETSEEKITLDTSGEIIEKVLINEEDALIEETPLENTEDSIDENNTKNTIEDEDVTIEDEDVAFEDEELTFEDEDVAFEDDASLEEDALIEDETFDQEILGDWDGDDIDLIPYRLGIISNFTFLQIQTYKSDYGLRADLLFEREIIPGTVIGLELGFGADHIDYNTSPSESHTFYKELVTSTTFSQEFSPKYSKVSYFYKIKFGSLIPISEDFNGVDETPYIRLGLALGTNFNISDDWMIRVGFGADINYRNEIETSEAGYIGLIYKFK